MMGYKDQAKDLTSDIYKALNFSLDLEVQAKSFDGTNAYIHLVILPWEEVIFSR